MHNEEGSPTSQTCSSSNCELSQDPKFPTALVPSNPNILPIGSLLQVSGLRTALSTAVGTHAVTVSQMLCPYLHDESQRVSAITARLTYPKLSCVPPQIHDAVAKAPRDLCPSERQRCQPQIHNAHGTPGSMILRASPFTPSDPIKSTIHTSRSLLLLRMRRYVRGLWTNGLPWLCVPQASGAFDGRLDYHFNASPNLGHHDQFLKTEHTYLKKKKKTLKLLNIGSWVPTLFKKYCQSARLMKGRQIGIRAGVVRLKYTFPLREQFMPYICLSPSSPPSSSSAGMLGLHNKGMSKAKQTKVARKLYGHHKVYAQKASLAFRRADGAPRI
ncbi:hypothetical protein BKA83DRAFT_4124180 [Pisolithus microcarpus]|nr:hypothetical protein BKA83DRAFT_4124180 [Pisolithus microcarpus]